MKTFSSHKDDPNGVYARFLGLLRAAPGLYVSELVDTLRIVVSKNVEFLSKSQGTLTHEISQLYSSEPQKLQEECPPDADGGTIATTPSVVHADSSVGPWEPCFSASWAKDIIRHANEFDPVAYANATREYKHAGGPRRSDRGYQPSVQAPQNLADAPPSALLAIDANFSIYPIPDPANDEQADESLQAGE